MQSTAAKPPNAIEALNFEKHPPAGLEGLTARCRDAGGADAVGRQAFTETDYVLQVITRSLISRELLSEKTADKFKKEIMEAVAEHSQKIDVRGVAFEYTVDLLRKAAEK